VETASHLPLAAVADRPIVSAKMINQEQRFAFLKKKKEKKMQKKIQKKVEKKKEEEAAEAATRILIRNHCISYK
jgi:Tfp pilus assembly protein PilN